jgi:hypothetical protein
MQHPAFNALLLVEAFGNEMLGTLPTLSLTDAQKEGAYLGINAMIQNLAAHRALLEAHEQRHRLN